MIDYSSIDAYIALTNKTLILNILLIVLIFAFLWKFNTYGSVMYWVTIVSCVAGMLFNGFTARQLSGTIVIITSLLIFVSYIIPYNSTDEILLHKPLKIISGVLFTIVILFLLGVILSAIPSTSSFGRMLLSLIRLK